MKDYNKKTKSKKEAAKKATVIKKKKTEVTTVKRTRRQLIDEQLNSQQESISKKPDRKSESAPIKKSTSKPSTFSRMGQESSTSYAQQDLFENEDMQPGTSRGREQVHDLDDIIEPISREDHIIELAINEADYETEDNTQTKDCTASFKYPTDCEAKKIINLSLIDREHYYLILFEDEKIYYVKMEVANEKFSNLVTKYRELKELKGDENFKRFEEYEQT